MKKHIKDSERYSIITDNLEECIICGRRGINKHEIFGGRNRQTSKDYGLIIPLCVAEHHNQYDCKGIHFDKDLRDYWHKKGQLIAMEYYHWTEDDFRKRFYKSYL